MTSNEPGTGQDVGWRRSLRPGWMSRIPARILGGFRTTTVVMVVVFFLVLVLWNNVRFDPTKNENSPVYVPPTPTSITPTEEPEQTYAPTTTVFPTTTTPSPTVTTTAPGDDTAVPSGQQQTTGVAPTTTRAPGFQLPTIPGLPLPTGTN